MTNSFEDSKISHGDSGGICACSISLPLPPKELWELMWRTEGQYHWLNPKSRIKLRPKNRYALYDGAGVWRHAFLKSTKKSSLSLEIAPMPSWQKSVTTTAIIRIAVGKNNGSTVFIDESNVPEEYLQDVQRYWNGRLDKLRELVATIRRRRKSTRQAVVVIHGIGEQQPGATLGSLVDSGVLSSDQLKNRWVKPDQISGSYELRKVILKASDERPTTHVFEFYWAHIIRDTTVAQSVMWLLKLLRRFRVPAPLRPLWLFAWALIVLVTVTAVSIIFDIGWATRWFGAGAVGTVVLGIVWTLLGRALAVNLIGDAARYLMPHPENVAHRQRIRKAGVDLIRNLQNSRKYDRIVVLGHSLGSVIAYDIITHAWAEMNETHQNPTAPSFRDVSNIERNLSNSEISEAHNLQHAAWRQSRKNTQPWLVTDLVTVGSPLTYADFLVALSYGTFEQAKADRTLPTCPPVAEIEAKTRHKRISYDANYPDPFDSQKNRTFATFHHAAPFAITRWTNLYFKVQKFGLSGDLIGGPLKPSFGKWIKDTELTAPKKGVAHTWYWRKFDRHDNSHLTHLKDALSLDSRKELLELIGEIPAHALLNSHRK